MGYCSVKFQRAGGGEFVAAAATYQALSKNMGDSLSERQR